VVISRGMVKLYILMCPMYGKYKESFISPTPSEVVCSMAVKRGGGGGLPSNGQRPLLKIKIVYRRPLRVFCSYS
jgi:hypothetical protein